MPSTSEELLEQVTLTAEGRRNLTGLSELIQEILNPVSTTQPVVNQIRPRRRRSRKVEAVKQAVGIALFLILYIVANSVAPTVWTAAGTVPLN